MLLEVIFAELGYNAQISKKGKKVLCTGAASPWRVRACRAVITLPVLWTHLSQEQVQSEA